MPKSQDGNGLLETTDVVKIYVHEDTKEEWKQEAEERELSLSKHLRITIQTARHLREKGRFTVSSTHPDPDLDRVEDPNARVEELKEGISDLRTQVEELRSEKEREQDSEFVDIGLALDLLTGRCTSLDELVEILFEYPEFQNRVRNELKLSLFRLGGREEADYVRGHGWNLKK